LRLGHRSPFAAAAHAGAAAGALSERLPRLSLHEAGLELAGAATAADAGGAWGGGGSGVAFQWAEEPLSSGCGGSSARRPRSGLERARAWRQAEAQRTDRHAQRVAQPAGPPLDPRVYATSRRVLPVGPQAPHSRGQPQTRQGTRGGGTRNGGTRGGGGQQATREAARPAGFAGEYWEEEPWNGYEGEHGDSRAATAAVTLAASSSFMAGTAGGATSGAARATARGAATWTPAPPLDTAKALSAFISDF
jgi:hypothetical protein